MKIKAMCILTTVSALIGASSCTAIPVVHPRSSFHMVEGHGALHTPGPRNGVLKPFEEERTVSHEGIPNLDGPTGRVSNPNSLHLDELGGGGGTDPGGGGLPDPGGGGLPIVGKKEE